MNPALEELIYEIVKDGRDLVVAQAPESVQQYLAMQAMDYAGWFVVCVLIGIGSVVCIRWANHDKWDEMPAAMFGCVGVVALFIVAIGLVCNSVNYWQVKFCPKGYLLQQVVNKGK